ALTPAPSVPWAYRVPERWATTEPSDQESASGRRSAQALAGASASVRSVAERALSSRSSVVGSPSHAWIKPQQLAIEYQLSGPLRYRTNTTADESNCVADDPAGNNSALI